MQNESQIGTLEKGLFTKEIERELLENRADIAVHSLKDLPVETVEGLCVGTIPLRESPHDCLILKDHLNPEKIPDESIILTNSPRRQQQWLKLHPGTRVMSIRGNIDTRIRKLREQSDVSGILLAEAGLNRIEIDLTGLKKVRLPFLPAPGQGALGLQTRDNDTELAPLLCELNHFPTQWCVTAERSFLNSLGGGCREAIGALATLEHDKKKSEHYVCTLSGILFSDGETQPRSNRIENNFSHQPTLLEAVEVGQRLATTLKEQSGISNL